MDFTHLVAMTPWTCASLLIRRTAIFPSLLNLGGVCVCFSTSSLISARAFSNLTLLNISFGPLALRRACHADITSNLEVRRAIFGQIEYLTRFDDDIRALINATASLIAFFVCVLKTSFISGNGGFHFSVFPRSP